MKIRKRPADEVVGDRQLSACVLGLPYDRFWGGFETGRFCVEPKAVI